MNDLYKYEKELNEKGIFKIAGVDEVGRGPLIGPVVACCCMLNDDFNLPGLNDSKKLSEKKRNLYFKYIINNSIYGIGIVDPKEIDEINIYQASKKAMMIAIEKVMSQTNLEYVLVDAMKLSLKVPSLSIIKGDSKSISIAAASVVAKVTRDSIMYELDKKYPQYKYGKHKGYPTKEHLFLLKEYGLIEGYRYSYNPVKNMVENNKS